MFKPTEEFTEEVGVILFRNEWSAFSVSDVIMGRFPQYEALRDRGACKEKAARIANADQPDRKGGKHDRYDN